MRGLHWPSALVTTGKMLEYETNRKRPRADLEAKQLRKFRRLVAHAQRRSPYYAEVIAAHGIDPATCTPLDFPVLTKTTLIENFDRMAIDRRITRAGVDAFLSKSTDANDLYLGDYKISQTSGSSGEIGYFVFGHDDWARAMAQHARFRRLTFPRQKVAFFGALGGHFAGISAARAAQKAMNGLLAEVLFCEVNEPLAVNIDKLNAFQPDTLMGYTSSLCALAEKQQQGVLHIAPKRIDATGDPLTETARAQLGAAFGAEIFNVYACSEHQLIAISRPVQNGMVLYDDDLICEFHDDSLIVTNLYNFTLPLIRYRLNDVLRPRGTTWAGGPYLELEELVGRSEIRPVFTNRLGEQDFISPITIVGLFVAGVRQYRMELTGPASFRFLVCLTDGQTPAQVAATLAELRQRLDAILTQKLMDNVAYEIVQVDDLPVDPVTRKFKLIIDSRGGADAA